MTFLEFLFYGTKNISIPAIVAVFPHILTIVLHRSGNCSSPLLQKSWSLIVIQVRGFLKCRRGRSFPGLEMYGNPMEKRPRNNVDGIATPSRGPSAFSEWISHDTVSRCSSGSACDWGELRPPYPLVTCRKEWSRQFHFFQRSPSTRVRMGRRRNTASLSCHGLVSSQRVQDLDRRHTIRGGGQDHRTRFTFHLGRWRSESAECWRRDQATKCKYQRASSAAPMWGHEGRLSVF